MATININIKDKLPDLADTEEEKVFLTKIKDRLTK